MKIVILLGAPGSGKGTIAGRLVAHNSGFKHVSSGELLRDAVKRQTLAGLAAEDFMKRGELVPDQVIADMIKDYIADVKGECTLLLPVKDGICDACGTGLVIRKDDNPETVKNRLAVYKVQTVPLIDFYSARGVLKRIDGFGVINDIVERVRQVLI
jgi:adenylate kinase